jgi:hypothetical protein
VAQPFRIDYRPFVAGDAPRPYLIMVVTGANGRSGPVMGLVDSGADTTSFPFGYASLMGYSTTTLTEETFLQAAGTGSAYRALAPSSAHVPEIPDVEIEMYPQFVRGAQLVLWGRRDFMTRFDVTIQESQKAFIITPV